MAAATELERAGGLGFPSNGGSQASRLLLRAKASAQGYKVLIIENKQIPTENGCCHRGSRRLDSTPGYEVSIVEDK